MKILWCSLFFFITTLSFQPVRAQHCKWDALGVMVFRVHTQPDLTDSLDNLMFTLVDSLGNPSKISYYFKGEKKTVQLSVFKNEYKDACKVKSISDPHNVRCFWFANNNYVLVAPPYAFKTGNLFITIENKESHFEKYKFSPDPNLAFPLCSRYSHWESGPESGFVEDFKTMNILLTKK
jgi:hypothetical protein